LTGKSSGKNRLLIFPQFKMILTLKILISLMKILKTHGFFLNIKSSKTGKTISISRISLEKKIFSLKEVS
jgi:hypothetical protein